MMYCVRIPGHCVIPEASLTIQATILPAEAAAQEPPGTLLRAAVIDPELTFRNWLPGDRFRPAHSGLRGEAQAPLLQKTHPRRPATALASRALRVPNRLGPRIPRRPRLRLGSWFGRRPPNRGFGRRFSSQPQNKIESHVSKYGVKVCYLASRRFGGARLCPL